MAQEQSADPGFSEEFDPEKLMKQILASAQQEEEGGDANP